jgi:uncharacterized protein
MTDVLATLSGGAGDITFALEGPSYERLNRSLSVRTAKHERAGAATARQALGYDETLELEGVLFPFWRGRLATLDALDDATRTMEALLFTDGRGGVHGRWIIETFTRDETLPMADGSPRKISFTLSLGSIGRPIAKRPAAAPVQGAPE